MLFRSTCQRPTAAPISTTQYIVTATDSNGCTATDAVTVQVNAKYNVYVPNTFTPNNDGTNDGFTVYGGNAATLLTFLRIFDRWGTLIYETTNGPPNDPTKGWNGTYKGVLLGSDVFVYYTEVQFIDGTRKVFKGDITLLR